MKISTDCEDKTLFPQMNPPEKHGDVEKYERINFMESPGLIPFSIWDLRSGQAYTNSVLGVLKEKGSSTREGSASYFDGAGERTKFTATTSYFNPFLARTIYRAYSNAEDIVLDPFASIVRPFVAKLEKRKYVGYEIRSEEVNKIARFASKNDGIEIKLEDCRKMDYHNEFNLIFTCPPYWSHEKYSELPEDISNIGNYNEFLDELEGVGRLCLRAMRKDGFCVLVVSSFRDYSQGRKLIERLLPFTSDVIFRIERVGFYLYDHIIALKPLGTAPSRLKLWNTRKTVRVHEDVLVFRTKS